MALRITTQNIVSRTSQISIIPGCIRVSLWNERNGASNWQRRTSCYGVAHCQSDKRTSILLNTKEFCKLMNSAVSNISKQASAGMTGYSNAEQFEKTVLAHLKAVFGEVAEANQSFHDRAFPDIVVNGFGVEVKFTTRSSWHTTGNSIFEGMKDDSARVVALILYRADLRQARWRWYKDCIKGIRISHSPRYMIDMESDNTFFDQIGMSIEDFREADLRKKMQIIKIHVRKRTGDGERFWWFDEEREHTLPINIRIYRLLDSETKAQMRAEAAFMCPQIFKGSRQRGKYDDAALYLLTQHGVFAPQTRDLFSAGSVAGKDRGGDYLIRSIQNIKEIIRKVSTQISDALILEYWGESCDPEHRLTRWLELADSYRPDDPPSQYIDFG